MQIFDSPLTKIGGNGSKSYRCNNCESLISNSDRLITILGTNHHQFINPAGIECIFHSFYSCQGAVALGEPIEMNCWFKGYVWRMAFCKTCLQHLGWYYEATEKSENPNTFWGVLIPSVIII